VASLSKSPPFASFAKGGAPFGAQGKPSSTWLGDVSVGTQYPGTHSVPGAPGREDKKV